MKKTLIASAVAAAALSTSAFAMDPATELAEKLDSMPTIYGNIQLVASYADAELEKIGGVSGANGGGSDYDFADNGSTIGFKHSHEIAPGLTAFLKAEFEFSAAEKSDANQGGGGGLAETDEAYIGLKGDFGSVWAGTNDTIYETWVEDTTDHFEFFGVVGEAEANLGNTEDRTIEYVSPSMGGLQLGVAYQMNGQYEAISKGGDGTRDNLIVGAKYSMDALTLAAVYGNNEATAGANGAIGVSAEYQADSLKVGFAYEAQEDLVNVGTLLGVYTMGANQFALAFAMAEEDGTGRDGEVNTVTLQALHNMSDNFYVYTEAQFADGDEITNLADTTGNGEGDSVADLSASQVVVGATYIF